MYSNLKVWHRLVHVLNVEACPFSFMKGLARSLKVPLSASTLRIPRIPAEKAPDKPKMLCSNSLDPQLPSQYTHTTKSELLSDTLQKEVLIISAGSSLDIWLGIM